MRELNRAFCKRARSQLGLEQAQKQIQELGFGYVLSVLSIFREEWNNEMSVSVIQRKVNKHYDSRFQAADIEGILKQAVNENLVEALDCPNETIYRLKYGVRPKILNFCYKS